MFFVLSKVFWGLAAPLNLCAILFVAGALSLAFARRIGRLLLFLGIAVFALFGVLPLGHNLLVLLESLYPPFEAKAGEKVEGILLLGGAVETRIDPVHGLPQLNDHADRIVEFVRLARLYPDARLLVSGGTAEVTGAGPSEAALMAPLLETLGLEDRAVLYEKASRNTYENAILSKRLVKSQSGARWILVTSAFHMPRSVAVFESADWSVVAAPADYKTNGRFEIIPRRLDVLRAMEESTVAIKEIIGLAAYRMSGKISSPAQGR